MGLTDLQNHYPIVFIGSGISKRYLANFPSWLELLEEYWTKIGSPDDLYTFLHEQNVKDAHLSRAQQDYNANLAAATHIQSVFDGKFFSGELTVEGLSKRDAQSKRISPFKYSLAQRFSDLSLKPETDSKELNAFTEMITKSKMIITTNYDNFIEKQYASGSSKPPKVYVGQQGLFDEVTGWAELYKIHGSVDDPDSIIINQSDYQQFESKSILITAKILSSMINYPIIFFGYSMTDLDIRNLLSDFSAQLPNEDIRKTANRIFVVQYNKDAQKQSEEIVKDSTLALDYTLITARDFTPIYESISQINEGLTPVEIQKYSSAIKELIISQGSKGALSSVLLSPSDLDAVMDQIHSDAPIVVAIGNNKNIYVTPTPTSYITDYITKKFDIQPANALRFIARQQNNGRYPFLRHYNNFDFQSPNNGLEPFEIDKLNQRRASDDFNLDKLIDTLPKGYHPLNISKISDILAKSEVGWKYREILNCILYNCKSFKPSEFNNFIVHQALPQFVEMYKSRDNKQGAEKSALRKLFVAWDIMTYGQQKS